MLNLLVVLVGGLLSIVAALLSSIGRGTTGPRSLVTPTSVSVLGCGLALTALVVSYLAWSESKSHLQIAWTRITAYTEEAWPDDQEFPYPPYLTSWTSMTHRLKMDCASGYSPITAWHEVVVTHPNSNVMYTVDASVEDAGIYVTLRSRQGAEGYAYIEVFALCGQTDSLGGPDEYRGPFPSPPEVSPE